MTRFGFVGASGSAGDVRPAVAGLSSAVLQAFEWLQLKASSPPPRETDSFRRIIKSSGGGSLPRPPPAPFPLRGCSSAGRLPQPPPPSPRAACLDRLEQKKVGDLSGGERNRLQLAKTLAGGGNVLVLDEPTNDLDVTTLRALEEAIVSWNGVVLCISHDRWFLNKICTHILAYEGNSAVTFFEGSYAEYAAYRKEALGGAEPKAIKFKPMPTPA